jgi:hypothetical protein
MKQFEESIVTIETLEVYSKTHESSEKIEEIEVGKKFYLNFESIFERFYEVKLEDNRIGYISKKSHFETVKPRILGPVTNVKYLNPVTNVKYLKFINIICVLLIIIGIIGSIIGISLIRNGEMSGYGLGFWCTMMSYSALMTLKKRRSGWLWMHLWALILVVYVIGIFMFIGLYKNKHLYN